VLTNMHTDLDYDALRETAFAYAFMLWQWAIPNP